MRNALYRYRRAEETDGVAAYGRALEAFSAAAERSSYTWTGRVMPRMGQVADLWAGRGSGMRWCDWVPSPVARGRT